MSSTPPASPLPSPPDPRELLRSKLYVVTLIFAALVGVPVAAAAYFFLAVVTKGEHWLYTNLPSDLGFSGVPAWWPIPMLVIGGVIVAVIITFLPGSGGHEPSDGFVSKGSPAPIQLPGIVLAALVTLCFGGVLGPEAPLIALGGGLGVLAVQLAKRGDSTQAMVVIGTAGSFAAISTLLGSPLVGAFLLMEVAGLGGPMLGVVLVPGLLAAGMGSLIFIGLDHLTGLGTFSLSVGALPAIGAPTVWQFLWAIVIGLLCALVGAAIKRGAKLVQAPVLARRILLTPLVGAAVGLCAVVFAQGTGHGTNQVLFSGETALAPFLAQASTWSLGAVLLLVLCKSLAYLLSLSSFRGGPIFPAIFIGAAVGVALSHAGHLPMIAGAAMGIGAMTVSMLGLPLTSVLLTELLLASDGAKLMPLVIVAVVVAYVASARLAPRTPTDTAALTPTSS